MIGFIDDLLDRITMYRLALYYLIGLLLVAFALGLTGSLALTRFDLAFSTVLVLAVCWLTNFVFVRVFAVPESRDSVWITALILVLIMSPAHWTDWDGIGALVFASVWAMASKYVVAVGRRHVFNPAAFARPAAGTFGVQERNALRNPRTWNLDIGVRKVVPIHGRNRLEVRAEAFNALNHPNWSGANSNPTSGSFGFVTSKTGERVLQLSTKYMF